MPLKIVRDDLVNMRADAVVLPSNERLVIDGGAGYAVARKAGLFRVRRAARKLGGCPVGSAVATRAFSFPARYLIHAVGPVWHATGEDAHLLRSAYDAALGLAVELGCDSVALPLLSAGTYGCPAHVSLSVALSAIEEFLSAHDVDVTLVLFDKRAVVAGLDFLGEIESRIDDAAVAARLEEGLLSYRMETLFGSAEAAEASFAPSANVPLSWEDEEPLAGSASWVDAAPQVESAPQVGAAPQVAAEPQVGAAPQADTAPRTGAAPQADATPRAGAAPQADSAPRVAAAPGPFAAFMPTSSFAPVEASVPEPMAPKAKESADLDLESRLGQLDTGFSQTLLDLIDESGKTDAQVYRRANMSRQHFSKIRNNVGYRPSKPTVLALCVALELDLDRTKDLLGRAGFALTHASKFDIIVEYFIERGIYDPFTINETLFYFDQQLLG